MADPLDGFDTLYSERLWLLLPAVYRTADTDALGAPGPLRELVERIGAQIAVVRRSIDRLWADQAIETCEDWVIPYLGDLLGTNLVNNLNPAGQRLDVAKTIHYRRRKGTVQILEELGRDITGWPCVVVEGFRRLGRTRHALDPAVGRAAFPAATPAEVSDLLAAERLTGRLTATPSGGFLDVRSAHGATLIDGPFDEGFHTADVRRGRGATGHMNLTRLLVHVWRLESFPVRGGTPVAVTGKPDRYAFDPTGRETPLFLPPPPTNDDFGDSWTPTREWEVPGPLSESLERGLTDAGAVPPPPPRAPYPAPPAGLPPRFSVHGGDVADAWPERGTFSLAGEAEGPITVDYQYGLAARIGAGPYDRSLLGNLPSTAGTETVVRGGSGFDTALAALASEATVTVADSLSYSSVTATAVAGSLLVRAGRAARPVIRPPQGADPWVFTGRPGAQLTLDGITLSGCDIVLRGPFDAVRLTACTIDPGTAAPGSPPLASAVDGRALAPARIFIEADPDTPGGITTLAIDHCILGPVRSRLGGRVEAITVSDSILQGLPEHHGTTIFDPLALAEGLLAGSTSHRGVLPLSAALLAAVPGLGDALTAWIAAPADQAAGLPRSVVNALESLILGPTIYNPGLVGGLALSPRVRALAAAPALAADERVELNRELLADAFPVALAVAAIAVAGASVALTRTTVLGRLVATELSASDSILAAFAAVANTQAGCVRFTAALAGSVVPRQYESVMITAGESLFASTRYGDPAYGQLVESADASIVAGQGGSISRGAATGSEMGAFSGELGPVKEDGLLVKYSEYMPLGLSPVIVHVT